MSNDDVDGQKSAAVDVEDYTYITPLHLDIFLTWKTYFVFHGNKIWTMEKNNKKAKQYLIVYKCYLFSTTATAN